MAKQAKGKGKAVTVPISGIENIEDFVQPGSESKGKSKAVAAEVVKEAPKKAVEAEEDIQQAEGSSQTADEEDEDETEDEYEVDEQAMGRLLELLGDVDASELGLDLDEDEDDDESDEDDADEDDEEEISGSEDEDESDEDDDAELDEDDVEAEQQSKKSTKQQEIIAKKQQDTVLERILDRFKINVPFFETQALTCPEPLEITDVSDDLSRELQFYKLSLWAARQASKLFKAANLPFERPNDYYAEMIKSDEHMEKIRQKLLDDSANIKASEQAKKQRHLKKFGKQVQVEKQKEREKSKREMNDKVKSFRKKRKAGDEGGDAGEFDIGVLDEDSRPSKKARGGGPQRGKSRSQRESKFGHSTTSRRPKENDRESTNAAFGGRGGRGGRGGGRGGMSRGGGRGASRGGGASKQRRPGKSKRQ